MYVGLPLTAVILVIIIVYVLINKLGIAIKFIPLLICGILGLFLGLVLPRFLVPQLSMAGTILLVLFSMFVLSVILAWIFGKEEYTKPINVSSAGYTRDTTAVLPLAADDDAKQFAKKEESVAESAVAAISFKNAAVHPQEDYSVNDGFEPALLNAPSFTVLRYVEPVLEKIAARLFPANRKIRPSSYRKSFKENVVAVSGHNTAGIKALLPGKDTAAYGSDCQDGWFAHAGRKFKAVLADWKSAHSTARSKFFPPNTQEAASGDSFGAAALFSHYHLSPIDTDTNIRPATSESFAIGETAPVYAACAIDFPSPETGHVLPADLGQDEFARRPVFAGYPCGQPAHEGVDKTRNLNQAANNGGYFAYNEEKEDMIIDQGPLAYCCLKADHSGYADTESGATYGVVSYAPYVAQSGQEYPKSSETLTKTAAERDFARSEQECPQPVEMGGNVLPSAASYRALAKKESVRAPGDEVSAAAQHAAAPRKDGEMFGQPQYAYTQKHCTDEDLPYKRLGDEPMAIVEKSTEQQAPAVQVPKSDSLDDLLDFAFTQKELGNWDKALLSLQMAYAMYPLNEFALLIIVETANIYKQMGNYDLAILELQKGLEKITAEKMRHDFILNIGYLRIIKNILKTNNLALLPYNEIPDKVKDDIEKEYLEWKNLSQQ